MKLGNQKKLAASILKCSQKKIRFDEERLEDIKESITRIDIHNLVKQGAIYALPKRGIARSRATKKKVQKTKGRQKSHGRRKGKATARTPKKRRWMNSVRKQRALIKRMKENEKIDTKIYSTLYRKVKGGFFRSIRHIKIFVNENKLIKTDKK